MNDVAGSARQLQRYPGNKSADGVYHRIIGLMPPHETYIEPFVGSGAVFLHKKPAARSVLIDLDDAVVDYWRFAPPTSTTIVHGDALRVLRHYPFNGRELVYCDPPYVLSARRSSLPLYRHEMNDRQHAELLTLLKCLPCPVMLSGYRCDLYDNALSTWRRVDFKAATHAGVALESLWFNFEPIALHDWQYLGDNFRERERIKRKQARWRKRLAAMPALERAAMMDVLLELASPERARVTSPAVSPSPASLEGELPV